DHDDAVVDGDADQRHQADHGKEAEGDIKGPEPQGCAYDRQRHGGEDDEGLAETVEQDHQHPHHQHYGDDQRDQGRTEGLAGIGRLTPDHGTVTRRPVRLNLVQPRLQLGHDLADGAALVLAHDSDGPLAVDVGNGDGRLGLARFEQLTHVDGTAVLGKDPHPGQFLDIARTPRPPGPSWPAGTPAAIGVVTLITGDTPPYLAQTEGTSQPGAQIPVVYAEEGRPLPVGLHRQLGLEHADLVPDIHYPIQLGQQ